MNLPENIRKLKPYTSARDLLNEHIRIFLDANENPYANGLNRYPDPAARKLTSVLSKLKGIPAENLLLTNGSDEGIDLLLKAFCQPGKDKVLTLHPTYGIYEVRAQVNNIPVVKVDLDNAFNLRPDTFSSIDSDVKLVFLCSPNNPTGNVLAQKDVEQICRRFNGLVVLDEAYIDFSDSESMTSAINEVDNLVVLQTLSKAWGMASARLGITFASKEIVQLLMGIKLPYNLSGPLQSLVLERLGKPKVFKRNVQRLVAAREQMAAQLKKLPLVKNVYPSEANFILAEFDQAEAVYKYLVKRGIRIRNFATRIPGCLRISIGTQKENRQLMSELKKL